MKVVAYQVMDSKDMLIVDLGNNTVERQTPEGTILWREMFLERQKLQEYLETLIAEGSVVGTIM